MLILMRRLSRSGVAPAWFYVMVAAAFAALVVWAVVQGDWVISGASAAMIAMTVLGARFMRRVAASNRQGVDDER